MDPIQMDPINICEFCYLFPKKKCVFCETKEILKKHIEIQDELLEQDEIFILVEEELINPDYFYIKKKLNKKKYYKYLTEIYKKNKKETNFIIFTIINIISYLDENIGMIDNKIIYDLYIQPLIRRKEDKKIIKCVSEILKRFDYKRDDIANVISKQYNMFIPNNIKGINFIKHLK